MPRCGECGGRWLEDISGKHIPGCPWCKIEQVMAELTTASETIKRLEAEDVRQCRELDDCYERIRLQEEIITQADISDDGLGSAKTS